ncbi:DUF4328 domain-containing protein [Jejudonia soesokkakensis]|uniref:DUF4328 domain-containing protein n=1 Tax=Jejudonia soesokkakensis TaxID=1323432 RepID=A0ABW2MQX9_9FLAO
MSQLHPNTERGKTAVILLWVMAALELATFISEAMQYFMIQEYFETGEISDATADSNDMRQALIYILYLAGFIICVITFISWFRRAYYNLGLRMKKSKTDGWAAGAWFVPILNLFWPYQIMVELYEKTIQYINSKHPESYTYSAKTTVFVGWWWAFWILNNIMGQVVSRVTIAAETIEDLSLDSQLSMVNAVLGIVAALFAIKVVTDYMKLEKVYFKVAHEPERSKEIPTTSAPEEDSLLS